MTDIQKPASERNDVLLVFPPAAILMLMPELGPFEVRWGCMILKFPRERKGENQRFYQQVVYSAPAPTQNIVVFGIPSVCHLGCSKRPVPELWAKGKGRGIDKAPEKSVSFTRMADGRPAKTKEYGK